MGQWDGWVGREERASDTCSAGFARRFLGTFDLPAERADALPQSVHWCLAVPDIPTRMLGPDGHPARDGAEASFLPPIPLERRMWASSEAEFLAPIEIGAEVERISRIANIETKKGRSGELVFVTVRHEWFSGARPAVRELQQLVYREAGVVAPARSLPSEDIGSWDRTARFRPDPALLFRYSALTFNGHRIHYDADYARDVEHYPGLVVHGPLTASQLLLMAAAELGSQALARFSFRALAPAFAGERITLCLRRALAGLEFAAFAESAGSGRRRIMEAQGTPA